MKRKRWVASRLAIVLACVLGARALAQTAGDVALPPEEVPSEISGRSTYLPDPRRSTPQITSVLDRESLSLRGDGDAAGALRRVTGVSIAGGRFVSVRGLNERYSLTTLNGAILPSSEPLVKAAPLDLFPTAILDSLTVQKTYDPSLSAQFAGASINIRTRSYAEENFLTFGLSGGYDSASSLVRAPIHAAAASAASLTGFRPDTRTVPGELQMIFDTGSYGDAPAARRNEVSRLLTDGRAEVFLVNESNNDLDWGGRLGFGRSFGSGHAVSGGFIGYVSYDNKWDTKTAVEGIGEADLRTNSSLRTLSRFDRLSNTGTVRLNAMLSAGLDINGDHLLRALAFLSRASDTRASTSQGSSNNDPNILRERLEWIGRDIWSVQMGGSHALFGREADDMDVSWRVSTSGAGRDAPYQVFTEYEVIDGTPLLRDGSGIAFSDLEDSVLDMGIDVRLPLRTGRFAVDLVAGAAYAASSRQAQNDYVLAQNFPAATRRLRVDHAYWAALNDPSWAFGATRSAQSPSFYRGMQSVRAGYLGLDARWGGRLSLAGGGRYESFSQSLGTAAGRQSPALLTPEVREEIFYPSLSATLVFLRDGQIRLGYSQTVNRPQFREIGPSRYTNIATNEHFIGNPFLQSTRIANFDARAEYYFDLGQFLALGVFHKELADPIEAYNVGSGESRLVTFVNVDSAVVQGIEAEYHRLFRLDAFSGVAWFAERDFHIQANFTWSRSRISAESPLIFIGQSAAAQLAARVMALPADTAFTLEELRADGAVDERRADIDTARRLQGQSDILANFQVGYFRPRTGADLTFLVNYQSARIRAVESIADNAPAIIEEIPLSVDVVYGRPFRLGEVDFRLSAKATNILGGRYRAYQSVGGQSVDVNSYEVGRSFSVSLEVSL